MHAHMYTYLQIISNGDIQPKLTLYDPGAPDQPYVTQELRAHPTDHTNPYMTHEIRHFDRYVASL